MSLVPGPDTDRHLMRLLYRVISLQRGEAPRNGPGIAPNVGVAPYTTNMTAAFQMVEWFEPFGFEFALTVIPAIDRHQMGMWTCTARNGTIEVKSAAETVPLAISTTMLAVLTEVERDYGG